MLSESPYTNDKYTVRTWCTFGDPNLQLRTKLPAVIASSNEVISPAVKYETTITAGSVPVEGALICLSQDGVYAKGFTDELGNISLEHPFTEGEVLLVVTAFNTTTIYETLTLGDAPELFAPQDLTYEIENVNHIILTWNAPESKALAITGYNVYRDDLLISLEPVREEPLTFTDIALENGEYEYVVTTLYGNDPLESEPCEPVMVTVNGMCEPIGKPIVLVQVENQYAILVSWEAPDYDGLELAGYNVYRDSVKINTDLITDLNYPDNDETLEPNISYCYQVEVVYNDCEGDIMTEEECLTMMPLSINELAADMFHVFPNPTTGELTITNYELRITDVEVFDIFGKKQRLNSPPFMEGCQPQADGVVMDISELPTGIYFVKITTNAGEIVKKIVKN
jgi:hypothetical protein